MPADIGNSTQTQQLLDRVRGGDAAAFDDLCRRHRPFIRQAVQFRLDPRMQARVDPSDVVQVTLVEAHRRIDDYLARNPMPFQLWLHRTAVERLRDLRHKHLVSQKRDVMRERPLPDQSSLLLASPLLQPAQAKPSELAARREHARQVVTAVGQLDEQDRELLLMLHVEGFSQKEVAQQLQITHAAARKRYGRALLKLRNILTQAGLAPEDI